MCSSCCIIQLLLNSFSVGCAGFAALTPYRPAFLSITVASLVGNYLKYRNKRRTALAVAVAFGLTVTPELVRLFNEGRLPKLPRLMNSCQEGGQANTKSVFHVEGMKCLACCAKVKQHVLTIHGVEACEVDFERGEVTVRGMGVSEEVIVASLESLGYRAAPMPDRRIRSDEAYQEKEL